MDGVLVGFVSSPKADSAYSNFEEGDYTSEKLILGKRCV